MIFKNKIWVFVFIVPIVCLSQKTYHIDGISDKKHSYYAFENAKIYKSYDVVLDSADMLIRDGKIVAIGRDINIPKSAIVYDLTGKIIYPSFIDMDTDYGLKAKNKNIIITEFDKNIFEKSTKRGAYNWNQAVQPENYAVEVFEPDYKQAEEFLKVGFGSVLSNYKDGIIRGTATLVSLAKDAPHNVVLKAKAANNFSFDKGSSIQNYPGSLTGSIALIRQTYLDAIWYSKNKRMLEYNISLEDFNKNKYLPNIFAVREKFSAFRAKKIADEFRVNYIIRGSGDEYKRIKDIKKTGLKYIIPLNFPKDYETKSFYDLDKLTLQDLKHWETAVFNPAILEKNGIEFAITTSLVKDKKIFLSNLRKSIKKGLSKQKALKALTYTPAKLLKVDNYLGSLGKGYWANFFISSDDFLKKMAMFMKIGFRVKGISLEIYI